MAGEQHILVDEHRGPAAPRTQTSWDCRLAPWLLPSRLQPGSREGESGRWWEKHGRKRRGFLQVPTQKLTPSCPWGHGQGARQMSVFPHGNRRAPGKGAQDHGQRPGSGPGWPGTCVWEVTLGPHPRGLYWLS